MLPSPRLAQLVRGLGSIALGIGLIGVGFWRVASIRDPLLAARASNGLIRFVLPAAIAIGYGLWTAFRALRPEGPPVLSASSCWECSSRIASDGDGSFCDRCGHPVHTRCKARHDRIVHG